MNQPKMTPERYTKVRALFLQVCELDPLDRSAILDSNCSDDPQLREQVESLLLEDERGSGIVGEEHRRDRFFTSITMPSALTQPQALPCSFGRYRLLRVIGEGGMGAVYEAEQLHPQRTVALKVLRPGLATAAMLRRFEYEAHVLGLLQHSGIAQIFEAGTADQGHGEQPYFVMELVRGQPLLRHAAEHRLTPRQKLELMAKICDAVQHAHTKGVVHRDLKPSNILIDESGQPKILDFGVARATDYDVQTTTLHTQVGQLVGTLAYMSPEQAGGNPDEVDTRSDVYSLGVICYELLANRLPLNLDRKPLHEAVRIIREQESVNLGALDRAFRGDIETIVAKAMENEPGRRYQSARELAADCLHVIRGEPIIAQTSSWTHQLRHFARRHRTVAAVACATFAALTLGVVSTAWGLHWALRERDRARDAELLAERRFAEAQEATDVAREQESRAHNEADKAVAVRDFLTEIISESDPNRDVGRKRTVIDVLHTAQANIAEQFSDMPGLKAVILGTLGKCFMNLGEHEEAERLLERSVALFTQERGEVHEDTFFAIHLLGSLRTQQGRYQEAEVLFQRMLDHCGELRWDQELNRSSILHNFALLRIRQRQYQDALHMLREAVDHRTRILGAEHEGTLASSKALADVLADLGELQEAEALTRQTLAVRQRVSGPTHPRTLTTAATLAETLRLQGKYADAESLLRQVIPGLESSLGHLHPTTLFHLRELGRLLSTRGKRDEAERVLRETLEKSRSVYGDQHMYTAATLCDLGMTVLESERLTEAEGLLRQALDMLAFDNEDHLAMRLSILHNLGSSLKRQGRFDEAERMLREVLEIRLRTEGEHSTRTLKSMNNLATTLVGLKRYEEAEELHRKCLGGRTRAFGPDNPQTLYSVHNLADLLITRGRIDEALILSKRAYEGRLSVLGQTDPETVNSRSNLALCLMQSGMYESAVDHAAALVDHATNTPSAQPKLAGYCRAYGECLLRLDRYEEAKAVLLQAQDLLRSGGDESTKSAQRVSRLLLELEVRTKGDDSLAATPKASNANGGLELDDR